MMLQVFCLKCITSRRIILMLYAKESVAEEIKKKKLQICQCLPKLQRFMSLKSERFLLLQCDIHIAALNLRQI